MAGCVTAVQSLDKGRGGRGVTGVHGSVTGIQNKSFTGGMKNEWAQKCNRGMASRFTKKYDVFLGMEI